MFPVHTCVLTFLICLLTFFLWNQQLIETWIVQKKINKTLVYLNHQSGNDTSCNNVCNVLMAVNFIAKCKLTRISNNYNWWLTNNTISNKKLYSKCFSIENKVNVTAKQQIVFAKSYIDAKKNWSYNNFDSRPISMFRKIWSYNNFDAQKNLMLEYNFYSR